MEFEASTRTQETTTSFGYQMELPEANMVFRGSLCFFLQLHKICGSELTFLSFLCRYDKQSVHNRRCTREALVAAACHPHHGGFRKSQRRQAAGGPRRHRGISNPTRTSQNISSLTQCISATDLPLTTDVFWTTEDPPHLLEG